MDAESILSYYESKDFEWYYIEAMCSSAYINNDVQEIIKICDREFGMTISTNEAVKIFDYIYDNVEEFVSRFSNYYVGSNCVNSVSFGEQEEQLFDIYNPETGECYELHEIQPIYEEAGFYVQEGYAYLDLSDEGMCIKITREQVLNILRDENI